jgi:hypothetical protein
MGRTIIYFVEAAFRYAALVVVRRPGSGVSSSKP